jgi:flagellar basal-body rod protein FlgB
MKLDFFQDQTLDAMGAYMTRLSRRQQIVTSNLINKDTPGFKTKDISFHATMQELLSESMEQSTARPENNNGWIPVAPQPMAFEVQGLREDPDRNNVDLDMEMVKLSETRFEFSMIAQLLRGKFRTIGLSINEGKV